MLNLKVKLHQILHTDIYLFCKEKQISISVNVNNCVLKGVFKPTTPCQGKAAHLSGGQRRLGGAVGKGQVGARGGGAEAQALVGVAAVGQALLDGGLGAGVAVGERADGV